MDGTADFNDQLCVTVTVLAFGSWTDSQVHFVKSSTYTALFLYYDGLTEKNLIKTINIKMPNSSHVAVQL